MEKDAKIYVAGHKGMVGSAIVRELNRQGYTNIITRTHQELDLTRQAEVEEFFAAEKPEYVFLAAAKVGGIVANQNALADFMWFNMTLEMNVINSAWKNGCKKLEFLGSSCNFCAASKASAGSPVLTICFNAALFSAYLATNLARLTSRAFIDSFAILSIFFSVFKR